jgi:hypothetical protein
MIEEVDKTLETSQVLINSNQFGIADGFVSIIYLVVIIISMIILLISLVQFTYRLLNTWTPWYKLSYKKPIIFLAIWLFLIPAVFIVMTLINLLW